MRELLSCRQRLSHIPFAHVLSSMSGRLLCFSVLSENMISVSTRASIWWHHLLSDNVFQGMMWHRACWRECWRSGSQRLIPNCHFLLWRLLHWTSPSFCVCERSQCRCSTHRTQRAFLSHISRKDSIWEEFALPLMGGGKMLWSHKQWQAGKPYMLILISCFMFVKLDGAEFYGCVMT